MLEALKQEAFEANIQLPKEGLINLTFGNASVLDRAKGIFAIKPSGIPYLVLKAEHMVLVDLEGYLVEGSLKPSSDTPTHRHLFLAFEEVQAIVHTHSTYATAFAQAGVEIPAFGTTHADHFRGLVPVTRDMRPEEIAGAYEWETGKVIVERFQGIVPMECPAVLVNRHGPFCWGRSAAQAVENAVALECVAHMALLSRRLTGELAPMDTALLDRHFQRKHGVNAYYGQKPSN